jgi:hypothetical protein
MPDWFTLALPNSATQNNVGWGYNNAAQWTFTFASTPVPASDLNVFNYSAWVVNNDGYNLPNGSAAATRSVTGDVGGANFTLNYVPGPNDPGGTSSTINWVNVDFLQIVQAISNYGNDQTGQVTSTVTRYFIDNGGDTLTPFYNLSGGAWGYVYPPLPNNGQPISKFMDDTPYRTEDNGGYGNGQSDAGPDLLSIVWQADTFLAYNMGPVDGTQNDVLLYGGLNWGFTYSDTDTPEPSTFTMAGIGLALMIAGRSWFRPRASAK